MANPKLDVDVRGNTKPLERQLNKVKSKGVNLNLNSKNFSAPLGKIKGELGEFDKSLAASNARVLAFGASAGAIFAIQKALSETVKSTIAVEKSLAEVNVILGTSEKKLAGFGDTLFNIAKKTGRSFAEVSIAAGELARQGLAMEETLRRTSDAMILARLSGLGVEASVNAITAALNGFRNAALSSTAVVDKLIAVDQAFAVSGADLAEALRRVGSTAEGAGVSLNELLGIVTAAQQITARGGAVIGNSFKTIFTRIQRPRVLEALDELGVKTKNAAGASLSATQVLKNLANTFDRLSEAQQASIAELVGGVFQINVLKASLSDLGSQYSVFTTATQIAANASGESAKRNAQLNQTLSAGLNETLQNLTKLAAGVGKLTLEPAIKQVLSFVNAITTKLSGAGDAEDAGGGIAKALLGGIGKFLSGPGIALAAVAIIQLFNNLRKFAVDAFNTFTGLNANFKQQQQLQQGILQILQQNPKVLAQIQRGEVSVDQAAKSILGTYKGLNVELASANILAGQLAQKMAQGGATVGKVGSTPTITTKASGYIPNFADQGEVAAMAMSGMYTKSQMSNPRTRRGRVFDGKGGSFMASYNGHEKKKDVIGPNGRKGTIIASPAMQKALGFGFVPNFAGMAAGRVGITAFNGMSGTKKASFINSATGPSAFDKILQSPKVTEADRLAIRNRINEMEGAGVGSATMPIDVKKQIGIIGTRFGGNLSMTTNQAESQSFLKKLGIPIDPKDPPRKAEFINIAKARPKNLKGDGAVDSQISSTLIGPIAKAISSVSKQLFSPNERELPNTAAVNKYLQSAAGKEKIALTAGNIFEDAINAGIGLTDKEAGVRWDYSKSDFQGKQNMLKSLLGAKAQEFASIPVSDAKLTFPPTGGTPQMRKKIFSSMTPASVHNEIKKVFAAQGYIPNFVGGALGDAIGRENRANVTKSSIRIGQDRRLASGANPFGLAVTNTRDEPRGLKDVLANGFVPNFAIGGSSVGGAEVKVSGSGAVPSASSANNNAALDANTEQVKSDTENKKKSTIGTEKLFGAMMLASVATSVFAAAGEDASPAMQKFTAGLNAASNGAMVMTTLMTTLSGPLSTTLAITTGLVTALYSYAGAIKASTPKHHAAMDALDENVVFLKEQGDAIQQTQAALSGYTDALKSGDARQVVAAQEKYKEALLELEPELRNQIMAIRDAEGRQAALGKAAAQNAKQGRVAASAQAAQKELIARINKVAKEKTQSAVLKVGGSVLGVMGLIKTVLYIQSKMQASAEAKQAAADALQLGATEAAAASNVAALAEQTALLIASDRTSDAKGVVQEAGGSALAGAGGGAVAGGTLAVLAPIAIFVGAVAAGTAAVIALTGAFDGTFAAMRDASDALKDFESKYNDPDGDGTNTRSKKTDRQMTSDATSLLDALKGGGAFEKGREDFAALSGRTAADLSDVEKAKADRGVLNTVRKAAIPKFQGEDHSKIEERVIDAMENLGVSAMHVAPHIEGAGSQTIALISRMSQLRMRTNAASAEIEAMQEVLDRQAQAEAAAAAAIELANQQANGAAQLFRTMASGIAKARQETQQFNRDFQLSSLKGAAKLAAQFQTSFQQTAQEGDIKKIEIGEKTNIKNNKTREKGSQAMFAAISKQESVAKLLEKVDKGGDDVSRADQVLANSIRNLPNALAGGGAGVMMSGFQQILNQATQAGGALEGQKTALEGLGLEKILGEQMNAMAQAERTRQQQLRMADLQTRLAQEQNRIDQQSKVGGGIKAFLDPKVADKMEEGFNTSVDDFVTASNRGDSVKTGQAAGNLLGNLNEFMGADLMGPAADKLKDMVQGGLEQSLRGRANARADVLDQAAAKTGDSSLSELADTLRNQDFASIAATQTALEFKRQKMPDNIANMLGVQQQLEQLQREDNAANVRTATATASMANFMVGGGFAGAVSGIAQNMPPAIVPGLGATNTLLQQGANAMVAVARVLAGTEGVKQAGKDLQTSGAARADAEIKLQELLGQQGAMTPTQQQDRQKGIADQIKIIGQSATKELASINALPAAERSQIDPEYINRLKKESIAGQQIARGNLDIESGIGGGLGPAVTEGLKLLSSSGNIERGAGMGFREGLGSTSRGLSETERFQGNAEAFNAQYGPNRQDGLGDFGRTSTFGNDRIGFGPASSPEERRQDNLGQAKKLQDQLNQRFLTASQTGENQDQLLYQLAAVQQAIKMLEAGTFKDFVKGIKNKNPNADQLNVAGGMTATVPIEIKITDSAGMEKIEKLTYEVGVIKNALPAATVGAPMPQAK